MISVNFTILNFKFIILFLILNRLINMKKEKCDKVKNSSFLQKD